MKFDFFIIALAFALTGCTSLMIDPVPKLKADVNYIIKTDQTVTVGSAMVTVRRIKELPAYRVASDFSVSVPGPIAQGKNQLDFKKGQKLWVHKLNQKGRVLLKTAEMPKQFSLQVGADGSFDAQKNDGWYSVLPPHPYNPSPSDNEMVRIVQNSSGWPRGQLFEVSEDGFPFKGSFAAELIYTGKTGANTINMVYREFVDDLARPAFTQQLSFNLQESDVVAFKTIKIKVIKATNSNIYFQVLEDGGLPWVPER